MFFTLKKQMHNSLVSELPSIDLANTSLKHRPYHKSHKAGETVNISAVEEQMDYLGQRVGGDGGWR